MTTRTIEEGEEFVVDYWCNTDKPDPKYTKYSTKKVQKVTTKVAK